MGRVCRRDLPDGYFHVTARGVNGEDIYRDDLDRRDFVEVVELVFARCGVRLITRILMDTHYHLIVEATTAQLSQAMQQLNGIYARRFNNRHGRHGHLFGERFSSYVIRDERHMHAAIQYVLDNPVAAGMRAKASDWPWSFVDLDQLRTNRPSGRSPPSTSRQPPGARTGVSGRSGTATSTTPPRVNAHMSGLASTGS
jgi:putative transposase